MMPNFMRFAIGTLTRIPVPAPDNVNRHVATLAMSMMPAVGMLIALIVGIPMLVVSLIVRPQGEALTSLLIAVLAIAVLAWLTRAIHLDGLADTADALGSGRPAPQALEIARRSDIGPFGVLAIVIALALQAIGLALALDAGRGFEALVIAILCGRVAITIAGTRGIPGARADGLGAAVAGSVHPAVAIAWSVALVAIAAGLALAIGWPPIGPVLAAVLGLATALVVLAIARRRLGGITGDVLGACVEAASTAALVVLGLSA